MRAGAVGAAAAALLAGCAGAGLRAPDVQTQLRERVTDTVPAAMETVDLIGYPLWWTGTVSGRNETLLRVPPSGNDPERTVIAIRAACVGDQMLEARVAGTGNWGRFVCDPEGGGAQSTSTLTLGVPGLPVNEGYDVVFRADHPETDFAARVAVYARSG